MQYEAKGARALSRTRATISAVILEDDGNDVRLHRLGWTGQVSHQIQHCAGQTARPLSPIYSGHPESCYLGLMDVLLIRFRPDDEWLGELWVSASFGGFAGVSDAWFAKENLAEFAQALTAFPLPADAPPTISGGLGENEKNSAQELVTITFEPHNNAGAVRATVHLETANWAGKEHGLHSEATIRFLVTYGDLGRFAPALLKVVNGQAEEAVLTSTS